MKNQARKRETLITKEMLGELFEQGLAYRYKQERWAALQRYGATLLPSPTRVVQAGGQDCVEELIQPLLTPQTLTPGEVTQLTQLASAWDALSRVQLTLVRAGLEDQATPVLRKLAQDVIPVDQLALARHDPGYSLPAPFLRLDLVRTDRGFQVIDINHTRPAGLGDYLILDSLYEKTQGTRRFPTAAVFSGVVRACFESWKDRQSASGKARIAVLLEETAGDWHNVQNLMAVLRGQEWVDCVDVLPTVEEITAGDYNCVIRGRVKFGHPMFQKLLALQTGRYCVVSPLGWRMLGSKRWFVALRSPELRSVFQDLLGDHYAVLDAAIPETGVLFGNTVRFPDREVPLQSLRRQDWVLKPPSGSSAQGISLGAYTGRRRWDEACWNANGSEAILQRYFKPKESVTVLGPDGNPTSVDYHMKYGAFLYGGKVAGCEVMARPQPLVHGARDTYFSTCTW